MGTERSISAFTRVLDVLSALLPSLRDDTITLLQCAKSPAAEPGVGRKLFGGARPLPPALIIQDELHLISGPLGTVAALYELALDRLASRQRGDRTVRPKIVASTATVRRASTQIKALFDRSRTAIFPPPGPDRRDSFFSITVPATKSPGRLYVGLAAPGKGPRLLFLRALTTLLAAGAKDMPLGDAADPYLTALCYFNALRELGGARRIVEDEVRAKLADYGARRRRLTPKDQPFENRVLYAGLENTAPAVGILIYTASAGNQGTLGGLVEVSRRIAQVLEGALERQRLCAGDPVCADHDPATAADDRTFHGAACHGCLVIAETSCEARNLFLDRALLVDTVGPSGVGF